jgi:hypothetical protein
MVWDRLHVHAGRSQIVQTNGYLTSNSQGIACKVQLKYPFILMMQGVEAEYFKDYLLTIED